MEHKEKHLENLAHMISFIITSTKHATTDARIRQKIATAIARAINMSQVKGGAVETPEDTKAYQIAAIMKNADSWADFMHKIKAAKMFGGNPVAVLTAYGLKWQFRNKKVVIPPDVLSKLEPTKEILDIPDTVPEKMEIKQAQERTIEEMIEKAILSHITTVHEKYDSIIADLQSKLKNHKHVKDESGRDRVVLVKYEEI